MRTLSRLICINCKRAVDLDKILGLERKCPYCSRRVFLKSRPSIVRKHIAW